MALTKIKFAPGIHKESTQYDIGPTWWDCDKVRFRKGRPEEIGGWDKYSTTSYMGIARSLYDWTTADSAQYLGIGTNLKFYVEFGGNFYDVTPIRETATLTNPFSATDTSSTIVVDDVGHGSVVGDFVTYSGASQLGTSNITADVLNQEYQVAAVNSADQYTIIAKDTNGDELVANQTNATAGGTVTAKYQINTGTNAYTTSSGWGAGAWGSGTWGGGGSLSFSAQIRLYSQDSFADDLLFNPRLGDIYYWDESGSSPPSSVSRAISLSDASLSASNPPTKAMQVMVSPVSRHVIAFGCNDIGLGQTEIDPLLIRWSSQDSIIDWTPSSTNTAGGQPLATGKSFVGAVKTRQEIVVFTETAVHSMQFAGSPYVFRFSVVAENISICSPKAAVAAGDAVFFMDREGFYVYKGAVSKIPCDVLEYVYTNIDKTQFYKVHATQNPDHSEITWFYPVGTSPAEITNYVTYNYAENVWSIGTFQRAAWIQAASRLNPIASTANTTDVYTQYLYNHEFGYSAEGLPIGGYIESGMFEIGDGEQLSLIRRYIPSFRFEGNTGAAAINVTIEGVDFPMFDRTGIPTRSKPTTTVNEHTHQRHVRVRAREISMKFESVAAGYGWTMGDFRLDIRTDGRR